MAGKRRKAPETPPASEVVDDDPIGANAPETGEERAAREESDADERGDGDDDPEDDDAKGEDGSAVEAAATPPPAPPLPETRKVADAAKLRERLGEPAPVAGAIVDAKTGRVEVPAPGTFDPKRRPPQKP